MRSETSEHINMSEDSYLELSDSPLRFEAVNQLTNVFFDDSNKDVFAVRSGGVMGVVVKNSDPDFVPLNFRMEDHGPVLSIKFSLDHKILAVQRTGNSVEFMNFDGNNLDAEYSQNCKKNSNVLGFVWSNVNEVALITDHGVELYTTIPDKRTLKHLKTTSFTIQWFVWCSLNKIALLASAHGSHLLPVIVKQGTIVKLSKVETEPGRMALERDVTLATLYGVPAVLILRHHSGPNTAEVHVHTLSGPGQAPVKSHVLKLGLSGRFAINIVDDVVLVHHQASRSSLAFDISLPEESDGSVRYHRPVTPARSFKPVSLSLPGLVEPQMHSCELYSPNWVVFQPNIVIDAKLGCLWHIKLHQAKFCNLISDLVVCTQVALKRTNGKPVLLKLVFDYIKQDEICLDKIQESFNYINYVYRDWVEAELQCQTASPPNVPVASKVHTTPRVLIQPDDIFNEILQKMDAESDVKKIEWLLISYITSLSECNIPIQHNLSELLVTTLKMDAESDVKKIEWLLISYITSLSECNIPIQHNLSELLVTTLARQKKFPALQQFLQYGVITDSKPTACLLLSLSNMHPAASQMALDMLARIDATEELQEILLSEGQLLAALRLAENNANPRKFLTVAEQTSASLLHAVLMFFRNSQHYSAMLQKDERLLKFVHKYKEVFEEKRT